ncbi:MAG: SPOR domain-containing protein, partial [Desulfovibrio sp.]|nr:SPOR domain-containing protein [Desulfovibrio sp.]
MEPMEKFQQPRGHAPARRISLSVTPATLVGSLIMLVIGFVAVFSLGVLLGRGHTPEAGIPRLAGILPEPSPMPAPVVIATDEDGTDSPDASWPSADASGSSSERDSAEGRAALADSAGEADGQGDAKAGVMAQGDLGYRDHLKTGPPADKTKTQAGGGPDAPQNRQRPSDKNAPAPSAPEAQTRADTQVYRYVYQVASYKSAEGSHRFAEKLKAAGFTASTEKSQGIDAVWYRTLIDFIGKPNDMDALRDKL